MASKFAEDTSVQPIAFTEALGERYLAYAMSTIMSRSLPDVRDGLKPVHRRLLYAMLQLKLDPDTAYKKCARVVGDVIGKYHPHGDVAVYDTMVRLAQSFSVRYPLVDGQGNFGSIDGDNAAAMRYTEARLTAVAMSLMEHLYHDTVDFRPTYDGSDEEPIVFPSAFPNLLANGSEGIAVGMATSIPPHNVGELCDALLKLIKKPSAEVAELMEFVQGPDFPTGGTIIEPRENIIHAYETGRGSFRIRAKWEKEPLSHGMYQIVITEIPFQIPKGRLIEKIADLFRAKKLALLGNIRDESAEDMRLILEPKNRMVEPEMLMESLYKLTDLEARFTMNLNVLTSANVPKVLNLKEVLREFLDHRHVVLVRRSNFRLKQIIHRLELLDGYLIAYLNIDEVIRIIREEDHPKQEMMARFGLTDVQAEAILNMRLRSLRKLEEFEIKKEHDTLSAEKAALEELLHEDNENLRWKAISGEIKEIKNRFGQDTELGARRTLFANAPDVKEISVEAFVEKEPITILCSKMGWIRAIKGHQQDLSDVKYKEGDSEDFMIQGSTTDKLLVFSTYGKFYTIPCDRIPKGKGFGEPLRLLVDFAQDEESVSLFIHKPERKLLVASSIGKGFQIPEEDVLAQTRNGKQVLNLPDKAKAVCCLPMDGPHIAVIGNNRKLLIFSAEELPEMKRGQGVMLQRYKQGGLADIMVFNIEAGLTWQMGSRTRTEADLSPWVGKRATAGRLPPVGFPRDNKFQKSE